MKTQIAVEILTGHSKANQARLRLASRQVTISFALVLSQYTELDIELACGLDIVPQCPPIQFTSKPHSLLPFSSARATAAFDRMCEKPGNNAGSRCCRCCGPKVSQFFSILLLIVGLGALSIR